MGIEKINNLDTGLKLLRYFELFERKKELEKLTEELKQEFVGRNVIVNNKFKVLSKRENKEDKDYWTLKIYKINS